MPQLSLFTNLVMPELKYWQLHAELRKALELIEKQKRSLSAYRGHYTKRKNK